MSTFIPDSKLLTYSAIWVEQVVFLTAASVDFHHLENPAGTLSAHSALTAVLTHGIVEPMRNNPTKKDQPAGRDHLLATNCLFQHASWLKLRVKVSPAWGDKKVKYPIFLQKWGIKMLYG